ncbi:MAG: DUF5009 domain-containing protein, partial [Verrucomicrobia bacterium]
YTDTIFPFFLWIVGVAVPLSCGRRLEQGQSRRELFGHALRRAVILFGLGLFLASFGYFIDGSMARLGFSQWLHNYLTSVRIPGVLQRIAVSYLLATAIYLWSDWRGQIKWLIGLLAGYWVLMAFVPFPITVNGETRWVSGLFDEQANFARWIDSVVFNGPVIGTHVWKSSAPGDPEGLVSTLPAVATCLFGILTGQLLRSTRSDAEKTSWMFSLGCLLMLLGVVLAWWLPINKKIWTSSYAVLMAGLAMVCFATCYWLIDVQGRRKAVKPFAIYGMNAITVFVLSGVLGRILGEIKIATAPDKTISLRSWLFNQLCAPFASADTAPLLGALASPQIASLLWAVMWTLMLFLIAWAMYRKKWFVKF